jgi:hypothetical protein
MQVFDGDGVAHGFLVVVVVVVVVAAAASASGRPKLQASGAAACHVCGFSTGRPSDKTLQRRHVPACVSVSECVL